MEIRDIIAVFNPEIEKFSIGKILIRDIDMDGFYTSIETRDNSKKYKNKLIVIADEVVVIVNY